MHLPTDPDRRHHLKLATVTLGIAISAVLSLLWPDANRAILFMNLATQLLWLWS